MDIRKASETDIDSLLELNRQIGEFHYQHAPHIFEKPSAAEKAFLINALKDTDRLFLVANVSGKVVGFLTAIIHKNELVPFINKDPICRISTIVVDQNQRKQGIGKTLISSCCTWANQLGAGEIRLEVMEFNKEAQQFYNKLGFKNSSHILSKIIND